LVELEIIDDVANNERMPPRLWHKVRVVIVIEGNGDLRLFKLLRGGVTGETAMTS
jgi:hypothetical protein